MDQAAPQPMIFGPHGPLAAQDPILRCQAALLARNQATQAVRQNQLRDHVQEQRGLLVLQIRGGILVGSYLPDDGALDPVADPDRNPLRGFG